MRTLLLFIFCLPLVQIITFSSTGQADEYRREERHGERHEFREEERRRQEEELRRREEERRHWAEEHRDHHEVIVPPPVVYAPPIPSPGISIFLPIHIH